MRLSTAELSAIEQRAKAATPGEWITEFDPYGGYDCMGPGVHITNIKGDLVVTCEDDMMKENADFIASAKQDIPRLVADLRAALKERDSWFIRHEALKTAKENCEKQLETLKKYVQHVPECHASQILGSDCDCGLDEII